MSVASAPLECKRLRMARASKTPIGTALLVIFFGGGAVFCLLTILALAFPHSSFHAIWRLKPEALVQFEQIGRGASIALMTLVGAACGLSAIGLARNAAWGRRLAIIVLVINLLGDSLNALVRRDPKTLVGLPIGGVMIWYLLRTKPRKAGEFSGSQDRVRR